VTEEIPTPDEITESANEAWLASEEPVDEFVSEAARRVLEQTEW
jgi:hypothetical protein